jgi:hypothetical protein
MAQPPAAPARVGVAAPSAPAKSGARITLQSVDGENFAVDLEVARMSSTIKTMLDDLNVAADQGADEIIPLPNVRGDILKLVIEWSTYHKVSKKGVGWCENISTGLVENFLRVWFVLYYWYVSNLNMYYALVTGGQPTPG